MKICLVDNVVGGINPELNGGHNLHYLSELNKISNTKIYGVREKFKGIKESFFQARMQRKKYVIPLMKEKFIHFLYLDVFYVTPSIFKGLKKNDVKIMGTLHWYPNNLMKIFLLKKASKYIDIIIVHSEFIKKKLFNFGIRNVVVVNYPAFIRPQKNNAKSASVDKKVKITCLGGTRYDKGLDIVSSSFKYIDEDAKEKIEFYFVGKEQDIKYSDVYNEAVKNNINVFIKKEKLTDEEYCEYLYQSNVILLPYRRVFTGNSGPMTDGIFADKYILGPDRGNLGFLIKKHKLGTVFKQENYKDLAKVISTLPDINLIKNHSFKNELTTDNFRLEYEKIYNYIVNS